MALTPCRNRYPKPMKIASAASAFPKHYYSQKFLLEKLQEYWGDQLRNPAMLARLHRNVAVEGRHLVMPPEKYYEMTTWGQANDVWIQCAQELGEQALCRALHHAGLEPSALGALFFTSVTGISSPSIDALLINRMGLHANIKPCSDLWTGMRGGRRGNCARCRLRACLSLAGGRSRFGGTLLPHHPTRRSLGGQSDFLGTVRRWLRSGHRHRGRSGRNWAGNRSDSIGFLSPHRRDDGLEGDGKGLSHHALAGGARADSRAPWTRRGCISLRPRTQAYRHWKLGAAYRWAQSSWRRPQRRSICTMVNSTHPGIA